MMGLFWLAGVLCVTVHSPKLRVMKGTALSLLDVSVVMSLMM